MSFRRAAYRTSQFKRDSNRDIKEQLAKENTVLNFIIYFTQVKAIALSLKQEETSYI